MRTIVHLDADAFFASVEQAADTRLRGKPIAVGGERRGIIASASYEARKFGIYTPMPTARARKLCPKLIVLPGDYERYEQFSHWMFGYAYDFTPSVEQTSIDEGYFDLTANRSKPPGEIAVTISQAIRQSLKITVSEGIASNKLVSQIASKLNKPAALQTVPAGQEQRFLHPLPCRWLPGIGPKNALRLNAAGLAAIGQIAATPLDLLALLLGGQAPALRQFANGIDERPLIPGNEPQKSFSQQETFAEDVTDEDYVEAVLRRMADRLFATVREEGRSVRTLTVKVRYNDRDESQRAESLREPTDLETDVYGRLRGLLREAWQRRVSLRMVSLKLSNVYDGVFRRELPLEAGARNHEARVRLAAALDALRRQKGWSVVLRGHDLRLRDAPKDIVNERAKPPRRIPFNRARRTTSPASATTCAPLRVRSHYTFLDSTLSPAAIVNLAQAHGLSAVALTDLGNLHGAVEFAQAAQRAGIQPIIGTELHIGEHPALFYVESARGVLQLEPAAVAAS
jgi:nucleotidyltransferase/DNA polymerase involved in DNA repair